MIEMPGQYQMPTFDEIRSHSSMLTNERIDLLIRRIDVGIENAWMNPCIPSVTDYHASIRNFFINVAAILDDEQATTIMNLFHEFYKNYFTLQTMKKPTYEQVYTVMFILDRINFLLRFHLQQMSYFFKLGHKPVKGIEAAIKVVQEGGGIFGGSSIGKVPEDKRGSVAQNNKKVHPGGKKI